MSKLKERIELTSPHDLPGHQHGRQILLNVTGRYDTDLAAVEGSWQHDVFVTETIEDTDGHRARIDRDGRIIEQDI